MSVEASCKTYLESRLKNSIFCLILNLKTFAAISPAFLLVRDGLCLHRVNSLTNIIDSMVIDMVIYLTWTMWNRE